MCFRGDACWRAGTQQGDTPWGVTDGALPAGSLRSEQGPAPRGLCSVGFRERKSSWGLLETASGRGQASHSAALHWRGHSEEETGQMLDWVLHPCRCRQWGGGLFTGEFLPCSHHLTHAGAPSRALVILSPSPLWQ